MKNYAKLIKLTLIVVTSTIMFSCSDDYGKTAIEKTIVDRAVENPELSTLVAALIRADLVGTLAESGDYTVFAPTNQAFTDFLATTPYTSIDQVPVDALKQILLNHVIVGKFNANRLPEAGYIKTLATLNGVPSGNNLDMYVNKSSGVVLNGISTVANPNIKASNGIIHVVNSVIGLPTVVTFAVADPNFDLLQAALTRAGNTTDFVSVLSDTNARYTVFAPVNNAFADLLVELGPGTTLASIPEPTLDAVLKYHVTNAGNILSSDLTIGSNSVPTLQGSSFTITLPGTGGNIGNVLDSSNRASGLIAVDVQSANGVIHVLNRVLLPN